MGRGLRRCALGAAVLGAFLVPAPVDAVAGPTVTGFGAATSGPAPAGVVAVASTPAGDGYYAVASDGAVTTSGSAVYAGRVSAPVVGVAARPGGGYWLLGPDGAVSSFGGATGHGRAAGPTVAIAATPSGDGYWIAYADGRVLAGGDARAYGRAPGPVVGIAPTPTGRGYWLVGGDGAVYAFGDAPFRGRRTGPTVAMAATPSGKGYWLVGADGGVFTFGDARFLGAAPGRRAVAFAARADGAGYWLATDVTRPVTVAAMGDIHGEGRIRTLLAKGGNPLDAVAPTLRAADVSMVNLETPVGTGGAAEQKAHVFQADPALLAALRAAGVDVVNLANNHARDHGVAALLETRDRARAAGLRTVGAGADAAEAWAPAIVDTPAGKVAVVGMSRVLPNPSWAAGAHTPGIASAYDDRAAVAAVRRAAQLADNVVVMVHWGVELAACPDADQRRLADELVAAGADVVAGHHPHVLEAIDQRAGSVVAYSLGNAVWYHSRRPSDLTAVLTASLSGGRVVASDALPARIDAGGHPRLLGRDESARVRADLQGLRPGRGRC